MNDIIKPNNKLPPSPKNNFGSLRIEKLKNKKKTNGINITTKKIEYFVLILKSVNFVMRLKNIDL